VSAGTSEILGATKKALKISNVRSKDAGVYQVRVANVSGSKMSSIVPVRVLEPLSVQIEALSVENKAQRTLRLGEGVNFVAKVTGSGTIALQWKRLVDGKYTAISGATGEQYRINPATVADAGSYKLTATSSDFPKEVESDPVVLVVNKVPVILVHPVSLSVITSGSAAASALFTVVARSDTPVTYQWFKGADTTPLVESTSSVLRLASVNAASSGVYRVRITNAAGLFVETSASLRVSTSGSTTPSTPNAGASGTAFAPAAWWVYWTKASNATASKNLSGYLLLERSLTRDAAGKVTAVTPGRAVWVLGSSAVSRVAGDLKTDEWSAASITTQDASVSERGEFSAVAYRTTDNKTFTVSGRVETGGDAALYGAPEVMAGNYSLLSEDFEMDLSWDAEQVLLLSGDTDLTEIVKSLKEDLVLELAAIRGE